MKNEQRGITLPILSVGLMQLLVGKGIIRIGYTVCVVELENVTDALVVEIKASATFILKTEQND